MAVAPRHQTWVSAQDTEAAPTCTGLRAAALAPRPDAYAVKLPQASVSSAVLAPRSAGERRFSRPSSRLGSLLSRPSGRASTGDPSLSAGSRRLSRSDVDAPSAGSRASRSIRGSDGDLMVSEGSWSSKRRSPSSRRLGRFVDSRAMTLISVIFTIYALFGDDVRLVSTEKPADNAFNVAAVVCLLFFTIEICLKCIVQSDYFLGFYFILDSVATASIIIDLTWIADLFQKDAITNQGPNARSGRTARVGASLGRVVRVLRLVRVLKLYKAYYEKRNLRHQASNPAHSPLRRTGTLDLQKVADWDSEDDAWGDVDAHSEDAAVGRESLVGKRLVALTTRKVILLVLLMLLVLPFLTAPTTAVYASSASWGADGIWQAFQLFQAGNGTREAYEESLLKFVYYHNWFDGARGCSRNADTCATDFYGHLFWVGLATNSDPNVLVQPADQARIQKKTIDQWERAIGAQAMVYSMGTLPMEAREILSQPWGEVCSYSGEGHLGFSLLSRSILGFVDRTVRCPSDLRPQESFRETPSLVTASEFDKWHLAFFFTFERWSSWRGCMASSPRSSSALCSQ